MKTLILGLGNDILGDDALGIIASRELARILSDRNDIDVVESSLHGVALLETFLGYDRAIVIDAIKTGDHEPGTILMMDSSELRPVYSPSPHYAGLPELFEIANILELEFPTEVKIVAMEVVDPYTVGADLSEPVKKALPLLIEKVAALV
jgi:hydrogenase maturation protease